MAFFAIEILISANILSPFIIRIESAHFADLLDTLIGVLATIIGIGIPILFLVVEALVAIKADYLIGVFLEHSSVIWVAKLTIVTIAVLLCIRYIFVMYPSLTEMHYRLFGFFSLVAVFISLFEVGRVISRLARIRQRDYFKSIFAETLWKEIVQHLNLEVDSRLAKKFVEPVLDAAQLKPQIGLEGLHGYAAIRWRKSGRITDINLYQLEEALKSQFIPRTTDTRGLHSIAAFKTVQVGDVAIYLKMPESDIKKVSGKILDAFTIQKLPLSDASLREMLSWLKDTAIKAIHEDSEGEYEYALQQYYRILILSFQLPVVEVRDFEDWVRDSFGKWNITFEAASDIRDISVAATNATNDCFNLILIVKLFEALVFGLCNGQPDHIGDTEMILGLYQGIFLNNIKVRNQIRSVATYNSLVKNFLAPGTFWYTHTRAEGIQEFRRRILIYKLVIRTLAVMIKSAIDEQDARNVKDLLALVNKDKLQLEMMPIAYWMSDPSALEKMPADEMLEAEARRTEVYEASVEFQSDIRELIIDNQIAALAYLFEKIVKANLGRNC